MKKLLCFIAMVMMTIGACAQNYKNDGKPYAFYCQFIGEMQASGKVKPKRIIWDDIKGETKLTDKEGKVLEFNNMVELMNYMSKRGWTFVDCEIYGSSWYYYFFVKTVTNDKDAREGFYFESDFDLKK